MTREEMTRQVSEELEHIPDWPGEHQDLLRALYNAERRRSLGRKATVKRSANDVLQHVIAFIQSKYPGAVVHYDKAYFEGTIIEASVTE